MDSIQAARNSDHGIFKFVPDEALLHIFKFAVHGSDITLFRMGGVCYYWHHILTTEKCYGLQRMARIGATALGKHLEHTMEIFVPKLGPRISLQQLLRAEAISKRLPHIDKQHLDAFIQPMLSHPSILPLVQVLCDTRPEYLNQDTQQLMLAKAFWAKNHEGVRYLLERYPTINTHYASEALVGAAKDGSVETIHFIFQNRSDITNEYIATAIVFASAHGQQSSIDALVEKLSECETPIQNLVRAMATQYRIRLYNKDNLEIARESAEQNDFNILDLITLDRR